jgi:hypothetical protein
VRRGAGIEPRADLFFVALMRAGPLLSLGRPPVRVRFSGCPPKKGSPALLGRWCLKRPGSDETVSLGREVGLKRIPAIVDQSPHRFGFHR